MVLGKAQYTESKQVKHGNEQWIGCDFDGTLATYHGWTGPTELGEPIPEMVERVKRWIADGKTVKIFTARISNLPTPQIQADTIAAIRHWCFVHLGTVLDVTNIKDMHMVELYDDRAVQVEENTGKIIGYSRRGLV